MRRMKAAIFVETGRIVLDEKLIPDVGPLDALIRITTTTICGTDIHILKGEYPVEKGLTVGHEPVGVIEKLGSAVEGFNEGQRVITGAIMPSGSSNACQCGRSFQDGHGTRHGWKPTGGWKLGNTIDGCQAEYVLVPNAMGNLTSVPDTLTDEQVLMCPDIMSTGFSGGAFLRSDQTAAGSFSLVQRSSVPSLHMRCMITATDGPKRRHHFVDRGARPRLSPKPSTRTILSLGSASHEPLRRAAFASRRRRNNEIRPMRLLSLD